ncbi:MAG TPA: hydroxysqualene dehydroxylase HpnE [Rhizomicrobium sp.]|nr:hydroxysqualene dehydroxylase HpnE [Rhizomicrobium sp.]
MTSRKVFVIGAGLAGLSASVALAARGAEVELIESAGQPGGRCRSYFDAGLGMTIDNGNHLLLSGNHATMAYLRTIGAEGALIGPDHAHLAFTDLKTGKRWTIAANDGAFPLWLFDRAKRVPDTALFDYAGLLRIFAAGKDETIGEALDCKGVLWDRLLEPFFLAALNTEPKTGSAALAAALVRETFAKGGRAYRPRIAHPTLADAFIAPALRYLANAPVHVRLGERLRRVERIGARIAALDVGEQRLELREGDRVVLATPPWVTAELVPDIPCPNEFRAIVNAHFKFVPPKDAEPILGLLGGTAEWVFAFADRLSVTVSAADAIVDRPREDLATCLWRDVAKAHGLAETLPSWQVVKEKRATIAATPTQMRLRPKAKTKWKNLFLAGDWTDTGLPATIEGAIRSGQKAADLAIA